MLYTNINEWKKHLMKNESKNEYDSNGNLIYSEDSDGFWYKKEYDSKGNGTYYEDSTGYWTKTEYDSNGKEIYYENSYGYWYKKEYDSEGNEIYFVNSNGKIMDNRNINERKKHLVKESKEKENNISSSIKVGDKIKGSQGITKDRVGTIISIEGDMAQVDFGNGDKYGIALRRVTEGEFKKLGKSSEAKKN